jgi:putative transposase
MSERRIAISYESIRLWCIKFGPKYAKRLRRRHLGYGEVVDVFLQNRRDGKAAVRFFKRLLRVSGSEPRRVITDKLRSYGVAHRELIPDTLHDTSQYANNRAELSHQPTRLRERGMGRFKSTHHAPNSLKIAQA